MRNLFSRWHPAGVIVATRYHNVMCALKLCKPTISLGYSQKFVNLMADMGLAEFGQFAYSLDLDRLIEQFAAGAGTQNCSSRWRSATRLTGKTLTVSSPYCPACTLFPADQPAHAEADGDLAREGLR